MVIRPERAGDVDAVAALHDAAFGGPRVPDLVVDLRREATRALVAEVDDQVVGHVMFTRGWIDAPRRLYAVQVLSPLGVLPAFQRQGIGQALIAAGVDGLEPLVFLEGDPNYYSRFGFVAGVSLGFGSPSERIPDPGFQVMTRSGYEPSEMTGRLVYPEVFWRHDSVGLR